MDYRIHVGPHDFDFNFEWDKLYFYPDANNVNSNAVTVEFGSLVPKTHNRFSCTSPVVSENGDYFAIWMTSYGEQPTRDPYSLEYISKSDISPLEDRLLVFSRTGMLVKSLSAKSLSLRLEKLHGPLSLEELHFNSANDLMLKFDELSRPIIVQIK